MERGGAVFERWGNGVDNMIGEGIPEEVTFEKTPKWSEGTSQEKIWEEELQRKEQQVQSHEAVGVRAGGQGPTGEAARR